MGVVIPAIEALTLEALVLDSGMLFPEMPKTFTLGSESNVFTNPTVVIDYLE